MSTAIQQVSILLDTARRLDAPSFNSFYQELQRLHQQRGTDKLAIEERRLQNLTKLADLRRMSLPEVVQFYKIAPANYA